MSSIFSGPSDIIQSELEIQTAAITRRYDAEISFAEGNTYKVKKLEREKEQEIAKMKNEANRKMFAMQVIQAVAQTAMAATAAAISSYSSAIDKLNRRLNEPFVTVNTVEGDKGTKQAQEEYDNLMRNKTPRTQR